MMSNIKEERVYKGVYKHTNKYSPYYGELYIDKEWRYIEPNQKDSGDDKLVYIGYLLGQLIIHEDKRIEVIKDGHQD